MENYNKILLKDDQMKILKLRPQSVSFFFSTSHSTNFKALVGNKLLFRAI